MVRGHSYDFFKLLTQTFCDLQYCNTPYMLYFIQSVPIEVSDQSAQKVKTSVAQLTSSVLSEGKSTCVTVVHNIITIKLQPISLLVMSGALESSQGAAKKYSAKRRRRKKKMKRMDTVLEKQNKGILPSVIW